MIRCQPGEVCLANHPGNHTLPADAVSWAEWPGRSGPNSLCDSCRETIEKKLDAGLSAMWTHKDLRIDCVIDGSYPLPNTVTVV